MKEDTMPVTREQYDAAKKRQRDQPRDFELPNPSLEVLADVAAICEFEAEENRRQFPDPPDPCAGQTPERA